MKKGEPLLPLDGITVVSLEHAIAAPFCTRQLADLGARVINDGPARAISHAATTNAFEDYLPTLCGATVPKKA